jgi:hypothetical protein
MIVLMLKHICTMCNGNFFCKSSLQFTILVNVFIGLRVRRSNFMRSKFNFFRLKFLIIIDSISWSRRFSWGQNCLIMLFRVLISWSFLWLNSKSIIREFQSHDRFVSCKYDHEIEIQNKLLKFSTLHLWQIFSPKY